LVPNVWIPVQLEWDAPVVSILKVLVIIVHFYIFMRRYELIARFLLQWILFFLSTTAVEQRDKRSATNDRDIKINVLRDWKIWFEAMAIMMACMTSELPPVDSTSTYPTHHTTLQLAAG
jgi:hypothetical protein